MRLGFCELSSENRQSCQSVSEQTSTKKTDDRCKIGLHIEFASEIPLLVHIYISTSSNELIKRPGHQEVEGYKLLRVQAAAGPPFFLLQVLKKEKKKEEEMKWTKLGGCKGNAQ